MGSLIIFREKTLKLIDLLENHRDMDRDAKIADVEHLIAERDRLMESISGPYNAAEKELGKEIVELNQKLLSLLENEKVQIQADMKKLNDKKVLTNKYVNPYASMASADGMFYDKRN